MRNSSKLPGTSPRAPSPALSRGHRPGSRSSRRPGKVKAAHTGRRARAAPAPLQGTAASQPCPPLDTSLGVPASPQPVEPQLPLRKLPSRPSTGPLASFCCSPSGSQHRPGSQLLEHHCPAPVFTFRLPFAHRKRKSPCPNSDLPTFLKSKIRDWPTRGVGSVLRNPQSRDASQSFSHPPILPLDHKSQKSWRPLPPTPLPSGICSPATRAGRAL